LDLTPGETVEVILGAPRILPDLEVLAAWDAGEGISRWFSLRPVIGC
jgi:hypothetical protein